MFDDDDELLIAEITPVLEIDHQYVRTVEGYNEDLAAQIRRCGRTAARRLGYKVRTFVSEPKSEGRRTVSVVVTESTEQDEKRVRERSELLMNETLTRLLR